MGEVHLRVITLSLDRGPVRLGRLRDYFCGTDGVVFMVDAADRESLKEAKEGLEVCPCIVLTQVLCCLFIYS